MTRLMWRWSSAEHVTALVSALLAVGVATLGASGHWVAAFGLTVVAVLAVALVASQLALLVLVFGLIPPLAGLDRGLGVPGLRPDEALLLVGAAVAVTGALLNGRLLIHGVDGAMFLFALVATALSVVAALLSVEPLTAIGVGNAASPLALWLVYLTARYAVPTERYRELALQLLMLAAIAVATLALLQQLDVASSRDLPRRFAGETDSLAPWHTYYRATALFGQGHQLSAYLLGAAVIAVFSLRRRDRAGSRKLAGIGLVASTFGMAAAATATPALALIVIVAFLAVRGRLRLRYLVAIAVVVAAVAWGYSGILQERLSEQLTSGSGMTLFGVALPANLAFRAQVWTSQYLPLIRGHPWIGYGPLLPGPTTGPWPYTESQYVTFLLRGGIPLAAMFVVGVVVALRWLRRAQRWASGATRVAAQSSWALLAALIPMSLVDPVVTNGGLSQILFASLGVVGAGYGGRTAERL